MGCEIPLIVTNEQNLTFYSLWLFLSEMTFFYLRSTHAVWGLLASLRGVSFLC